MRDAPVWALEQGFVQVVTVVRGLSPREAVRRWGATRARAVRRPYDEVYTEMYDPHDPDSSSRPWITAWEVDDATVVWEPVSMQGTRREVLEPVTEGGASACAVNVEPHVWPTFLYAVDGQILARFEDVPGARSDPRYFTGVDVPEVAAAAHEAELTLDPEVLFEPGRGRANVALLQQALMGVVAAPSSLDDTVLAARITPRSYPAFPTRPADYRPRGTVRRVPTPRPRD